MDTEKGNAHPVKSTKYRYLALYALTLQSSLLILTMRFSRMGDENTDKGQYNASTAVFFSEILKMLICFVMNALQDGSTRTLKLIFSKGHYKVAVPAVLYVVQNHLQYLAASRLDAGTLQVTYQLKILTTAVFSVLFLHRSLRAKQWVSLLLLAAGVAVMQVSLITKNRSPEETEVSQSRAIGFGAVILVCVLSGAAGVYFEKTLKNAEPRVSVWVRNLQLGIYSIIPVLLVGIFGEDRKAIQENGVFYGYTPITYVVILLQAAGGILVANVVKYADNILKNFATSISIILSTCISHILWKTPITCASVIGASLVIFSTYWFTKNGQS